MERQLLLLKILPQASVLSSFHVVTWQLVTCFSYQTNSNYSSVQGKDSKFSGQMPPGPSLCSLDSV